MRHRKDGRRLGRNSSHRRAMLKNMVTSLLLHGRIRTTDTRAKEVRRLAERLITMGKKALPDADDAGEAAFQQRRLHYYRRILKVVQNRELTRKILDEYAELYKERPGGYTRILKLGRRQGDNAPISILELVQESLVEEQEND